MDLKNILIVVSAVVFIVLLWTIIGFRYLKGLKKQIAEQWEKVDEKLRKRQDLIPNLIETLRMYDQNQEVLIKNLIEQRMRAAKEYFAGPKKIEYEYDVSKSIGEIFGLAVGNKNFGSDTNFLELKKEIEDLMTGIEEESKKHNEIVRKYNQQKDSWILAILAKVFGFKEADIFEGER